MARPVLALLLASCLAAGAPGAAAAQAAPQAWPTKPIRAVVPLAPGTGGDVISRIILNQLAVQLGQSIVIENKGGAGGTIGAAMVAKADPDGYTLLSHSSTHVIAPSLYQNLSDTTLMLTRLMPRVERILRDVEVFADKIARHPESLGLRGAVSPDSGLKEAPGGSSSHMPRRP